MRDAIMRRLGRATEDERGSAIVTVVLVTAVSVLLATVVLQTAVVTLNRSGNRNLWEQSFHLAEAGSARVLSLLAADTTYNTADKLTASPTKAQVLAAAIDNPLEVVPEGQYTWVRVAGQTAVYGVGYVPSRTAPKQTRVVRVEYRIVAGGGDRAILTAGSLDISGTVNVLGVGGGVHANQNLTLSGAVSIERDATSTGTYTTVGHPVVGGQSGGGFPAMAVPAVDPPALRNLADYTICADGLIRVTTTGLPCTGALVGSGVGPGWNGWKLKPGGWDADCKKAEGTIADNKTFYLHQTSVDVSCPAGGTWRATIIADGAGVLGSLVNGDITLSGGGAIQPAKQGILFVAKRDMRVSGSVQMSGLAMAGEQMQITGSGAQAFGQLVAAGNTNSVGSPVATNSMSGTYTITAVFGAPSVQGGVETTKWNEISS